MKKIYIVEEEGSFSEGEEFETLEDAKIYFKNMLYNLGNYNYFANKKKIFTLESVEVKILDDNEEFDNWNILASCSIENFKDMDSEEKERLLDIKEM